MFRLTTFLRRAPGVSRGDFVTQWTGALSEAIMANPQFRRSVRSYVVNLPFDHIPEEFLWIACNDFDGVAELWFDTLPAAVVTANAISADPAVQAIASGIIDIAACASWIGHVVDAFDKPGIAVKRIVAGQPRPDLSLEAAQDYWLHEHLAFFSGYKEFMAFILRYRAIYGVPTQGLRIASHRLMAMCADVGFASLQDLSDAYREPRHAANMMTDIVKFGASGGAITFTADKVKVLSGAVLG
ncbi:hypothetical protein [Novosphingobium sp. CECT 9465]|uniref:hypothetical protein n=1 Tax=Novosphingobium sp. CECT 9465 TaxID=2829794 RepID=UPI001E64EB04|nr:hypothetical protein [Novosphingobium sp. CECT 9465]CAH0498230.1 hypothetical protein NVSP9465_03310 [Novosphingobium sp. CECT 9465]